MNRLRLRLLGTFSLTRGENPATGFRSDKERALLAYLATEALRPHHRDALAGLLWPDLPDETAQNNLRVTLHRLRKVLGDHQSSTPALLITRETIQINPAAQLWLDAAAFESLISSVEQHSHIKLATCPECTARYAEAAALYQGDFLHGFYPADSLAFSEWALLKREHLHSQALRILFHLADYYQRRGELDQALNFAYRQLQLEPWREEAHRQVMAVLVRLGERSAALRQYERCRQVLEEELGVEPSEETRALHQRILAVGNKKLHHLPRPETPFIGRRHELNQVGDLLADPDCRLLTILGPGGSGKSRLAIQAAEANAASFLHGVTMIQISGLNSEDELILTLARSLDDQMILKGDPRTQLLEYLREREVLLLLDSYEHLLAGEEHLASIGLLQELLQAAPDVKLLVTSRQRLNLRQEWVFPLGGLDIPSEEEAANLQEYGAPQMFLACARRISPRYTFGSEEGQAAIRICRVLEGLPLAIELAAARIREMPPAHILREIESNLNLLTSSFPDLPLRHRSLRATFEYSWDLLTGPEMEALEKLSVFPASFSREAAEQITGATTDLLNSLIDKSLLQLVQPKTAASGLRYSLHDVIRQFASEKLAQQSGLGESVKDLHRSYFMHILSERDTHVMGNNVQHQVVDQVQAEFENIRPALERAIQQGQVGELSGCFNILMFYYEIKGPTQEAERHFDRVRELFEAAEPTARLTEPEFSHYLGKAILYHAWYIMRLMRLDQAEQLNHRGLALARQAGDWLNQGAALNSLGIIARLREELQQARIYQLEAVEIFEKHDHLWWHAGVLGNLGLIEISRGDLASPQALLEQSLALITRCGDRWGMAGNYDDLGELALHRGDWTQAEEYFQKSLQTRREIGQIWRSSFPLRMLGEVAYRRKDYARAKKIFQESLAILRESGDKDHLVYTLVRFGEVCASLGETMEARESFLEAKEIAEDVGMKTAHSQAERNLAALVEIG